MRIASRSHHGVGSIIILAILIGSSGLFGLLPSGVAQAAGLVVDKQVSAHGGSSTSVTSPAFTTSQNDELLVAFIGSDGPNATGAQTVTAVTGGGLTWRLRQRTNTQAGTAEIWTAVAPVALTNVTVKATHKGSYYSAITVATFIGANTAVDGATSGGSALTGAPSVSLTTTRPGSWVWAVGNDWDRATTRTVGTGQTKVDEFLATNSGDTFWTQRQTTTTAMVGSVVALSDTAPTNDRWNMALIEIPTATVDTTPPSAPTNLVATAVGPNQVNLAWTASTDDVAVTGYDVLRDGVQIATTSTASFTDTTVSPSTAYSYAVKAYDAAANTSLASNQVSVTTPATDTTPPTIGSITSSAVTQTAATIAWTTDEPATSQVEYGLDTSYGTSTTLDTSRLTSHTQTLSGLTAGTVYHFRVKSADAAGNLATSSDGTFTTQSVTVDTTPPTTAITSPTNGTTVGGTIPIAVTASDNVGVIGVQMKLDGVNLGGEMTTAPYSTNWDTTTVADGMHTLTSVARDVAGNTGTSAAVTVTVNNSTNNPAVVGQWGSTITWPEVSIHAALTSTGKILTFQGDFTQGGQQYIYDPATGVINQVPNAAADLFCAGQAVTADGRILVIGGTSTSGGLGISNVTAFDPMTQTWQDLAHMNRARWYATGTTLGDGRVLVSSGYDKSGSDLVTTPEIYDVTANSWSLLSGASQNQPVYPFEYQLPDGRVLWAGASETPTATKVLDVASQTWATIDGRVIDGSSIVNYAPNKFMKAGSAADSGNSGPSAKTAFTLDMSQANPTWQPTNAMAYARSFVNLTPLPDGTVLATGGDSEKSGYNDANGILAAEQWSPATGTWKTLSSMSEARLYHSVAVLLPDGRVFVSGGGGDAGVPDHKSAQIYSPSYLFKGTRPVISSAPSTVQYGSSAFIGTPDASSIASISLIRTGSVTHSFDQNSRAVPLNFTQAAGGLNVQMPANGNIAPPGYYMLFIVNSAGVPSVSAMVRFPAGYEDATAPSAPTNLTATSAVGTATLNWTASTDNVGVTGYTVYRSTTTGFTPDTTNKIGTTATTTFMDSGVSGTYYYRVTATDAAGNTSAPSSEVAATILADTTAPSAPTNLTAVASGGHQVDLTWGAATDNVGVSGYTILRDGAIVAHSTTLHYSDTSVAANTSYSYAVSAQDAAGNSGVLSNAATVTTPNTAAAITVDKIVTTHQASASNTIAVTGVTTAASNELLVAFISSDGPASTGAQSISSVSGAGVTWRLRQRTNAQAGTAEIWTAVAAAPLTNVSITASRSNGAWVGAMSVIAFENASSVTDGAVAGANALTGSPSISLTTTQAGSWLWAVGDDWDRAVTRTVGSGQTKVDEFLAPTGDTFWVQSLSVPTAASGTLVTLNDTSPTGDRWNFAAIEILPQ